MKNGKILALKIAVKSIIAVLFAVALIRIAFL